MAGAGACTPASRLRRNGSENGERRGNRGSLDLAQRRVRRRCRSRATARLDSISRAAITQTHDPERLSDRHDARLPPYACRRRKFFGRNIFRGLSSHQPARRQPLREDHQPVDESCDGQAAAAVKGTQAHFHYFFGRLQSAGKLALAELAGVKEVRRRAAGAKRQTFTPYSRTSSASPMEKLVT